MFTQSIKLIFALFLSVFLLACSNVKSSYDYDNSVDFSVFKTYRWDTQPSVPFTSANPLIAKRIVMAIEDNLKRKGLVQAEEADITISYQLNYEKKLKSSNITGGIGLSVGKHNRGNINISSGNRLRETTEGRLMIDMASGATNNLIWRSITTKPVSKRTMTPEQSEDQILRLINGIFENFPPKKQ